MTEQRVFATIKIKIGKSEELEKTMKIYNNVCQEIIDHGWEEKTAKKRLLHNGTYKDIRKTYPSLSSAMVQTARDQASEMLKRTMKEEKRRKQQKQKKGKKKNNTKKKPITKPRKKLCSGIRYDKRTMSIIKTKQLLSLNTVEGRKKYPFVLPSYYERYKEWEYSNAQLIKRKETFYLMLQVSSVLPPKKEGKKVLGIDLGIKKVAVSSDNTFYSSRHLRNVKGKYQYMKRSCQRKGTKSAKRKLKRVSGKEHRFVRDVNHCISKNIVNTSYTHFVLEELKHIRSPQKKKKGKRFNRMLGNWSFAQLQDFLRYKAERVGKTVVTVDPRYTSQCCSKCEYVHRSNRQGNVFLCRSCSFTLDADLNASRNLARMGISCSCRLSVNQPNVGLSPSFEGSERTYKPLPSGRGN